MNQELNNVIKRIYQIAKDYYDNDVQTHISSIYNRLTDNEQTIFLRGMIVFLFDIEQPPQAIVDVVNELEEEFNIETFNQIELIRLKSWFLKCLTILFSFFMGITGVYILIDAFIPAKNKSILGAMASFLKTLFGL